MGSALRCLIRRHSNLTWGQGRQNNKSSLCSLLKNKACRLHMYHAHTNKLMKQCLEQWNLFGWTTKTSLRLDAWQAFISSLPLSLSASHCFSHSSFLLRSVCRCTRPQSCMLTPVSERIWMYDEHKSPLFSPWPTFTPHHLESIKDHFKADMKGKNENSKAEPDCLTNNGLQ